MAADIRVLITMLLNHKQAAFLCLAFCFIRVWAKPDASARFQEAGLILCLSLILRYTFAWDALQSILLQPGLHLVTREGRPECHRMHR